MHTIVFHAATIWLLLLVAVLVAYAIKAQTTVDRVLALDTLALVFVAALTLLAIHFGEPGMLDVALVLAMLGFVQTVAAVRLVERRKDLR